MAIDVSALIVPIFVVVLIAVLFSGVFTKNKIQEFWVDFSCFTAATIVGVIFIPDDPASIAFRMVVLILLWFTIGARFSMVFYKNGGDA